MVPPPVKSEAVAHLRGVSFEPPEDVPRSSFGRWGGPPVRMLADARMLRPARPHLRFAYGLPSASLPTGSKAYGLPYASIPTGSKERKNTAHPTKKARFLLAGIICIMTGLRK